MQIKCFVVAGIMAISSHAVSLKATSNDFLNGDDIGNCLDRLV